MAAGGSTAKRRRTNSDSTATNHNNTPSANSNLNSNNHHHHHHHHNNNSNSNSNDTSRQNNISNHNNNNSSNTTNTNLLHATPSRGRPPGRRGRPPNNPNPQRDGRERPPSLPDCFKTRCCEILDRLIKKDHYNIFLEPVNVEDVPGYDEIIKNPMDFTTMRSKLMQRQQYKSLGEFRKDLDLIWSNCLTFNGKEPNNVFTKKAIELRRLTEKLIVQTRQALEKDNEAVMQWKERHRRSKRAQAMSDHSANPSHNAHDEPSSNPSALGPDGDPAESNPAASAFRDSVDDVSMDHLAGEPNVEQSPQQSALVEWLRTQYAGNTGLHKKNLSNLPPPQYTKSDGSIVDIPVSRYIPEDEHWTEPTPTVSESRHQIPPRPLSCDTLLPRLEPNPCRPRPGCTEIRVDDYVASLFQFVKPLGPAAVKIIIDYLSPELNVKAHQDHWKRAGFNLSELAKKADEVRSIPIRPDYQPKYNWSADMIMELADDIERTNKRNLSLLPKLQRTVAELDGLAGLEKYLGKKMLKEVEDVNVGLIDFSMPHGADLETLQELLQLNRSALNLNPKEQASLEKLKKSAEDFTHAQSAEVRSRIPGASQLNSKQLHEAQVRAYGMKRQRKAEAERQAGIMAQCYAGAPPSFAGPAQSIALPAKRKRDQDAAPQATMLPHAVQSGRRGSGASIAGPSIGGISGVQARHASEQAAVIQAHARYGAGPSGVRSLPRNIPPAPLGVARIGVVPNGAHFTPPQAQQHPQQIPQLQNSQVRAQSQIPLQAQHQLPHSSHVNASEKNSPQIQPPHSLPQSLPTPQPQGQQTPQQHQQQQSIEQQSQLQQSQMHQQVAPKQHNDHSGTYVEKTGQYPSKEIQAQSNRRPRGTNIPNGYNNMMSPSSDYSSPAASMPLVSPAIQNESGQTPKRTIVAARNSPNARSSPIASANSASALPAGDTGAPKLAELQKLPSAIGVTGGAANAAVANNGRGIASPNTHPLGGANVGTAAPSSGSNSGVNIGAGQSRSHGIALLNPQLPSPNQPLPAMNMPGIDQRLGQQSLSLQQQQQYQQQQQHRMELHQQRQLQLRQQFQQQQQQQPIQSPVTQAQQVPNQLHQQQSAELQQRQQHEQQIHQQRFQQHQQFRRQYEQQQEQQQQERQQQMQHRQQLLHQQSQPQAQTTPASSFHQASHTNPQTVPSHQFQQPMGSRSTHLTPQQNIQQHPHIASQAHMQHDRHENPIQQQSQGVPNHQPTANQHVGPGLRDGPLLNGLHRPLLSDSRISSENRNDSPNLTAHLAGDVPTPGGRRPMAVPEGSKPVGLFPGPGANNTNNLNQGNNGSAMNGAADIGGFRQSPPQGISGQGLFAGRNVVGDGAMGVNNNMNHNNNDNNNNINSHSNNVDNNNLGQPRGSPINSHNPGMIVSIESSKGQQPQSIDVHNVNSSKPQVETGNASFSVDGSKPLPNASAINRLEMMPNFGGGDGIFDNGGGSSNGDVTGPGNIDGGFLFDDGDLAATTTGGDLEF